jgi:hypothetical protein
MPNWVFNSLVVSGQSKMELQLLKEQLNKPFTVHHDSYNRETGQMEKKETHYSNPVFAFWNIIAPTDLEAYYGEQTHKTDLDNFVQSFNNAVQNDNSWYYWNLRNWGCKWDVAVQDDEQYPDTRCEWTDAGELMYHFNTPWSQPEEAITKLSSQFPTLQFDLEYEEEQGWGGSMTIIDGEVVDESSYDIPQSHADYKNLDRIEQCNCEQEYSDYWFKDCPIDESKYKWDEELDSWVELENSTVS